MTTPKETLLGSLSKWLKKNFEGFLVGFVLGILAVVGGLIWLIFFSGVTL